MEEVNYRIIITDETGEHEITPVASSDTEGKPLKAGSSVSQKKAEKEASRGNLGSTLVAVKQIDPYVNMVQGFYIDSISFTTGSRELQQRMSMANSLTQQIQNIGMSAAIGGVAGAAIAAVSNTLMSMVSFAINTAKIQQNKQLEDESIGRRKSRLGQTVNRSRNGGIA